VTEAVLSIDVGGTKLAAAAVTAGGTIVARAQTATPATDAATVAGALTTLAQ
jgi:glucokinase